MVAIKTRCPINHRSNTTVIIIGAGLGGLSAAISLAAEGHKVLIIEKNNKIGGKLNVLHQQGFTFDLGPSILTLPHIFENLFKRAGKSFSQAVPMVALDPQWRAFFEDHTTFDLYFDKNKMTHELRRFDAAEVDPFFRFLAYSEKQYDIIEKGYFRKGLDTMGDFMRCYPLSDIVHFDLLRTMHQGVAHYIKNKKIIDVMDYFIKYVGSSAYSAPGFMNLLPTIQFRYKLWYVMGGMYRIAEAMGSVLDELGAEIHLNTEAVHILEQGDRVTGVETSNGKTFWAESIISNMETIPTYKQLMNKDESFLKAYEKFEPACSGLILELGVKRRYPQLNHHNFFISRDQKKHFHLVFKNKKLPEDPTIYLVAASRTDPSVAPEGCESLKILPHIPHLTEENTYTPDDYMAFKNQIVDKLERMGLEGLRENTIVEHVWTPYDIQSNYYSHKGSIYGVACDRWKNFALKTPKKSSIYSNLYFTGGSVNPGGGMPMVVLCGQLVSDLLSEQAADKTGNG